MRLVYWCPYRPLRPNKVGRFIPPTWYPESRGINQKGRSPPSGLFTLVEESTQCHKPRRPPPPSPPRSPIPLSPIPCLFNHLPQSKTTPPEPLSMQSLATVPTRKTGHPPGPVPSIVPTPHESNRTVPNLPRPDWKSNVTQASEGNSVHPAHPRRSRRPPPARLRLRENQRLRPVPPPR